MDVILYWNQVALDVTRLDFTTASPDINPTPQQGGPTKTSRALAIVHLAMYDAYAGFTGAPTYLTYASPPGAVNIVSAQAAVGAAAAETLIALFSRSTDFIQAKSAEFLATLPGTDPQVEAGLLWGRTVAGEMLASRANDNSAVADFYAPSQEPGRHRVDPLNPTQGFLGPRWGEVTPFMIPNLTNAPGLPLSAPPAINTPAYATAYNEVLSKGKKVSSTRTVAETVTGILWGYDGARNIGVPPRLYNQAVRSLSIGYSASEATNAVLFAAVNAAMADGGIRAWYEKYYYNYWRPVVGIREADSGWGPTGMGDGNPATAVDPHWEPLGAQRTNQLQIDFTPSFPAYPSGHATFGAVALRVAEKILGLSGGDSFVMESEEYDGKSFDTDGIRPKYVYKTTIDDAIKDNLESRIWLGVHWRFDGTRGVKIGEVIGPHIASNFPNQVPL